MIELANGLTSCLFELLYSIQLVMLPLNLLLITMQRHLTMLKRVSLFGLKLLPSIILDNNFEHGLLHMMRR